MMFEVTRAKELSTLTSSTQFGVYVFFPVGVMLYFGGPDFYDKYVRGINFWPEFEKTHVRIQSMTEFL